MANQKKLRSYQLDDFKIKNAKASEKEFTLRDGNGLFLLVHPNGSKYFQYRYSMQGKAKKTQIGTYPDLSLKDARQKAENYRQLVLNEKDPSIEKHKEKFQNKLSRDSTFETVTNDWLKHKKENIQEATYTKISGMVRKNTYSRLGKIPIYEITSKMLLDTLKVIESRGALDLMHRVRALLGEIFNYAISIGLYDKDNPANALRNSVILKKHKSENFKTFDDVKDVGIFLRRLFDYEGTAEVKLLVLLQMMVATRPSEMRTATWDEFDFDSNIWTIKPHRMKMGIEHKIPLPIQAIEALNELKQFTGHSEYLFPGNHHNKVLSENTANRALKKLWPEYLIHPHGFRSLFSTLCNEHDYTKRDIVEAALAHKDSNKIRAIYNKATYLRERKDLAQWYANFLYSLKETAYTTS